MRAALVLLFLLLAALPCAAQEPPPTPGRAARLLQRGDALFGAGTSRKVTWKAIGYYREALKLNNRSFEANWRAARAFARLADRDLDAGKNSGDLGRQGHYYAVQAIAAAPKRVEGYYWAAICVGQHGKAMGIVRAMATSVRGKLLRYIAKARRLGSGYEDGGPPRLLAMYHHSVPVPFKDNEQALKLLAVARKHSPGHSRNLYCWGRILWGMGRKAEARQKFKQCTEATRGGDSVINRDFQGRCRARLRRAQK